MLSRMVLSAWAKSDRESDDWLSLVRHCEDTVEVAGYLWDEWLPRSTRTLLAGAGTDVEARELGRFLAGTHDVGKLSPAFAIQVDSLCGPMRDAGLRFPFPIDHRSDAPHSVVGFRAMETYLQNAGFDRRAARTYAVVAGGHHGVPPTTSQIGVRAPRAVKHYGDAQWTAARAELIDHIVQHLGVRDSLERWAQTPLTIQQQVLWTGFVIMSDWIASNSSLFPLSERFESTLSAQSAWSALGLPAPWLADPPDSLATLMQSRFEFPPGVAPNAMQEAVVAAAQGMAEPGMLIVESTMGSGKTEAALAAAEHLAAMFGLGGVFVALPTMATSNAMFSRVHTWLTNQNPDSVSSVILAHGKSHLNREFGKLARTSKMIDVGTDADHGTAAQCRSEVIAHQWFFGRKRSMLSGFVVGTIDQLLFAGLKAKHVALRHLAIANKVIVIDEVHAADDYMRHYLLIVLQWLSAYRVPVILLSATLPGNQRAELVQAYERGRGVGTADGDQVDGDIGYPVVTSVAQRRLVTVVDSTTSASVALERLGEDDAALVELLRDSLVDGGCAAVIRNTVRRAQETARVLRATFGEDVVLLHSRFMAKHRADLEEDLVSELGRTGCRPKRRIVVATQVIEQSLDLDFDILVTDLAPMDLVLQRAGRLHRHERKRPEALRRPRLVLTGVADWTADPPVPERGLVSVYGASRLYRAAAVLHGCEVIEVPKDIPRLVQAAYADAIACPVGWEDAMLVADRDYDDKVADQRARADSWRLNSPTAGPNLVDWLAENVGDVDNPRGYAKVRDSDEGVEVLLTRRVGGQVYLLPQCGGDRVEIHFEPPFWLARKVLNSAVRLPAGLCRQHQIDDTIRELESRMYDGWQGSKWLGGELVIELDESGSADVGEYRLRYDAVEGLLVSKVEPS